MYIHAFGMTDGEDRSADADGRTGDCLVTFAPWVCVCVCKATHVDIILLTRLGKLKTLKTTLKTLETTKLIPPLHKIYSKQLKNVL